MLLHNKNCGWCGTGYSFSPCSSNSLVFLGCALPPVLFITCPIRYPIGFVSPCRICATGPGFSFITSFTISLSISLSCTGFNPFIHSVILISSKLLPPCHKIRNALSSARVLRTNIIERLVICSKAYGEYADSKFFY